MAALDMLLSKTQTSVQPGTITQSDTSSTPEGTTDTAPSFVTRESFAAFTGASALVAAIGVPLSKLLASWDVPGGWVPYALAMIWALLNIWNGIEKNSDALGSEKAITVMIGIANGFMLGTVGLGVDQVTPTPAS